MKTHIFIFYSIITLGILSVSPLQTHAQSIFVTTQEKPLHVGNTSLVTVMIDTGKAEINAIEGDISVSNSKDITWISTGGSVFTLWPQKPSLESGHIVFVGGTPNTVYGTSLKTFTFAYKPSSTKSLKISFKNLLIF
mgnify:FL=1